MKTIVAAVVSLTDLKRYFEGWDVDDSGDSFQASNDRYTVELKPAGVQFRVRTWAVDDESDSEEAVTGEPVRAIEKFIGLDMKLASDPAATAAAVRSVAIRLRTGSIAPADAARAVRRIAAALKRAQEETMDAPADAAKLESERKRHEDATLERDWKANPVGPGEGGEGESKGTSRNQEKAQRRLLEKFVKNAEGKGWKVEMDKGDADLPVVRVSIGDEFQSEVSVDSMDWLVRFQVKGGDIKVEEETKDPIASFRKFYKSDPVKEHWRKPQEPTRKD